MFKLDKLVDRVEDAVDARIASDKTDAKQDARLTKLNNFLKSVGWGKLASGLLSTWKGMGGNLFSKLFKVGTVVILGLLFNTAETNTTKIEESIAVVDSTVSQVDSLKLELEISKAQFDSVVSAQSSIIWKDSLDNIHIGK